MRRKARRWGVTTAIYAPAGKAQEYAESSEGKGDGLACNPFVGCDHGCVFCYVPLQPCCRCKGITRDQFHAEVSAKPGIVEAVERWCSKHPADLRPITLCFTCDPWPQDAALHNTTDAILAIFDKYSMNVKTLTKNPYPAHEWLQTYAANDWWFGVTILSHEPLLIYDDSKINDWEQDYGVIELEPNAADWDSRSGMIQEARAARVNTWVSVEPVVYTQQALAAIDLLLPYVDLFKVGKLNYGSRLHPRMGEIEAAQNWGQFVRDVKAMVPPERLHLKNSLKVYE